MLYKGYLGPPNLYHSLYGIKQREHSGAVEACWAHNPEVRGSKPRSANYIFFFENGFSLNSRQKKSDFTIFGNEMILNLLLLLFQND